MLVTPQMLEHIEDSDMLFDSAFNKAIGTGFVRIGKSAVLTAGLPLGNSSRTNTIRVMTADRM